MKCTHCGAKLNRVHGDLPFKVAEHTIVILKNLPILQCENCPEFLLEDVVMEQVDSILSTVDERRELEIIRYAA